VLITAAIGAILYMLAIRPARRASPVSLIIITIGAAIFIRGIAGELFPWGVDHVRPPFYSGDESISFLGAYIHPQALWIIGTTLVVTIILHLFLSYTMVGKALKACAISQVAAGLVGIDARAMALIAFALAAALGGIGGVVMAPLTLTAYNVGLLLGLKGFVAASIGGFKSPVATVIGGITLGIVMSLAVGVDWGPFTSAYKDAIAMMVLLLILLIRSGRLSAEERAG
jgi:branched-chain amino acid transport system permease protein